MDVSVIYIQKNIISQILLCNHVPCMKSWNTNNSNSLPPRTRKGVGIKYGSFMSERWEIPVKLDSCSLSSTLTVSTSTLKVGYKLLLCLNDWGKTKLHLGNWVVLKVYGRVVLFSVYNDGYSGVKWQVLFWLVSSLCSKETVKLKVD